MYQFEQDYEQQGATTESCIQPRKFKELICGDHLEFRTSRQQDASAFFQYLLQKVERQELSQKERLGERSASSHAFQFRLQERLECSDSGKTKRVPNMHPLIHR